MQVLDAAVLVVSGIDGVQAHTRTLWRLLEIYQVPTLLFVTKMDYARRSEAEILEELCRELSPDCVAFGAAPAARAEALATCSEAALEEYEARLGLLEIFLANRRDVQKIRELTEEIRTGGDLKRLDEIDRLARQIEER